jgi:hypothetical protein
MARTATPQLVRSPYLSSDSTLRHAGAQQCVRRIAGDDALRLFRKRKGPTLLKHRKEEPECQWSNCQRGAGGSFPRSNIV